MTWLCPSSPCTLALANRRLLRLGWAGGRNVRFLMFSSGMLWFSWNGFWSNKIFLKSIQQFTSFWTQVAPPFIIKNLEAFEIPHQQQHYEHAVWKALPIGDTTSVQTAKKNKKRMVGLPWYFVQRFMVSRGQFLRTLVIPHTLVYYKIPTKLGCIQTAGRSLR